MTARTKRMLKTKYGKTARKYEALPELFTPGDEVIRRRKLSVSLELFTRVRKCY